MRAGVFIKPSIWDVAAGVLIVREAGGDVLTWHDGHWQSFERFEPAPPEKGKGPTCAAPLGPTTADGRTRRRRTPHGAHGVAPATAAATAETDWPVKASDADRPLRKLPFDRLAGRVVRQLQIVRQRRLVAQQDADLEERGVAPSDLGQADNLGTADHDLVRRQRAVTARQQRLRD